MRAIQRLCGEYSLEYLSGVKKRVPGKRTAIAEGPIGECPEGRQGEPYREFNGASTGNSLGPQSDKRIDARGAIRRDADGDARDEKHRRGGHEERP